MERMQTVHETMIDPLARMADARREFGEYGGVNASVEVSTTFTVMQPETLPAIFAGQLSPDNAGCYLYGRSFNPTVRTLGRMLAALEGTEAAYACASGMSAISATLLQICSAGDHIVASNAVYGGTFALLKQFLPSKCGIQVTFVRIDDMASVQAAVTSNTKVIYTESLSNPTLAVADIPALANIAHRAGAKLVVDNTFAPCILSPAKWGADIVVHSLTKYINGASDIIAGAICGTHEFITSLMDVQQGALMLLGPTMDPKVASEISLRLPHLALRMKEHSSRALCLATKLQEKGLKVVYPGLPDHPQYQLLQKLANSGYGAGGIFTLDTGSLHCSYRLMERLQNKHGFGLMAVSLGYFDTLMSASGASTSSELSADEKRAAGISSGLVRFSVGITGTVQQRWAQLEEAVQAVVLGTYRPISPTGVHAQVTLDCPLRAVPRGDPAHLDSKVQLDTRLGVAGQKLSMGPADHAAKDNEHQLGVDAYRVNGVANGRNMSKRTRETDVAEDDEHGPDTKRAFAGDISLQAVEQHA